MTDKATEEQVSKYAPSKLFQVERHSGRVGAEFRVVLETDDSEEARKCYENLSIALRQGAVRLIRYGTIANSTSAPRLRSRW
jgi:hypothetical protein